MKYLKVKFSIEGYNTWSFRVESHLDSHHDQMCEVITNKPIKNTKVVAGNRMAEQRDTQGQVAEQIEGIPDRVVEKPREEFTVANFKVDNLDRIARNVIQSTVFDAYLA